MRQFLSKSKTNCVACTLNSSQSSEGGPYFILPFSSKIRLYRYYTDLFAVFHEWWSLKYVYKPVKEEFKVIAFKMLWLLPTFSIEEKDKKFFLNDAF